LTSGGASTPLTRTITTAWHPTFRLPTQIAEPLRKTTNFYDPDGTQCGARGALCSRTVQATTDPNGSQGFSATATGSPRIWSYTYNAKGRPLTVDGPRTDVSDVTTFTYYADNDADFGKRGNLATITNAAGHLTSITAYTAHGQPLTIVDPNGMITTLVYDARQRLNSRNVGGETTSYDYDNAGQVTKVTLPDASFLAYDYDDAHRLIEISDNAGNRIVYTLDAMGNRTQEEVRDPANALAQKRSRVYNSLNQLFQELGAQNQTTEYAYDNQGNTLTVKDPLNHITTNQYDALNRLKQVTDPGSGITQYAYNGLDALTQVTDPRGLATAYTLNGLGNLSAQVSPDTGTTTNTHDVAGNLLTQTDAKGQVTTYAYDALNRVSSATFHDGSKHVYSYDAGTNGIGRLTGIAELNAAQTVIASTAYAYDPKGRLISDTRTINGVAYTTGYRYDSSGRLDRITYPSGRTVDYSFDTLGRVSALSTTPAAGTASNVATEITYHPFGGVKSYTLGNGQAYARGYDQDGRVNSYTLGAAAYSIGYDAGSRIEFITEIANPANSNNYGYDVLNRLTSANAPGTNYGYSYDAVGNRLSKTLGAGTETYTYATTSNRIATITPNSGPVRSFTSDPNGSTSVDGNNTYAYDVRGRMIQSVGGLGTTSYQVNAAGQRVRKTSASADVVFHYDAKGHLIAESTLAGAMQKEYLWLGDIPVAVATSTDNYFVHVDHLNTPRLIADQAGMTVWKDDNTEPFGSNPPNENPSGLGAFEFPLRDEGTYADKETGLLYNWNRDRDNSRGQFLQADPLGVRGIDLSLYVLRRNNPLRYTDPDGLDVSLHCRPVAGTFGRYSHCFVHVTCPQEAIDEVLSVFGNFPYGIGGLPSAGYKSSSSPMEGGQMRDDPNSRANSYNRIITPQRPNCNCDYEKSVIKRFYSLPATQLYGGTESNSNTFAQDLITSPSFGTSWPPDAPSNAVGTLPRGTRRFQ
jgi:RHS repeat-associated protein